MFRRNGWIKYSGTGCMYSPEAPVGSIYSRKFNYPEEVERIAYNTSVRKTLTESSLQKPMTNEQTI